MRSKAPKVKTFVARDNFRQVVVVGCGGTGANLAEGLACMVSGYRLPISITLIDHDIIEEKNVYRQNFFAWEIGQNKAEVLSFRLNQRYGLDIAYSTDRVEEELKDQGAFYITCVDNITTRKLFRYHGYWLDLGNDKSSGQAIFGTTSDRHRLHVAQRDWRRDPHVRWLPNAYLRAGMESLADEPDIPSCAENPFEEQGPLVNRMAALAGLSIVQQVLMHNQVKTPSIYFNVEAGTMAPVRITKDYIQS